MEYLEEYLEKIKRIKEIHQEVINKLSRFSTLVSDASKTVLEICDLGTKLSLWLKVEVYRHEQLDNWVVSGFMKSLNRDPLVRAVYGPYGDKPPVYLLGLSGEDSKPSPRYLIETKAICINIDCLAVELRTERQNLLMRCHLLRKLQQRVFNLRKALDLTSGELEEAEPTKLEQEMRWAVSVAKKIKPATFWRDKLSHWEKLANFLAESSGLETLVVSSQWPPDRGTPAHHDPLLKPIKSVPFLQEATL